MNFSGAWVRRAPVSEKSLGILPVDSYLGFVPEAEYSSCPEVRRYEFPCARHSASGRAAWPSQQIAQFGWAPFVPWPIQGVRTQRYKFLKPAGPKGTKVRTLALAPADQLYIFYYSTLHYFMLYHYYLEWCFVALCIMLY